MLFLGFMKVNLHLATLFTLWSTSSNCVEQTVVSQYFSSSTLRDFFFKYSFLNIMKG